MNILSNAEKNYWVILPTTIVQHIFKAQMCDMDLGRIVCVCRKFKEILDLQSSQIIWEGLFRKKLNLFHSEEIQISYKIYKNIPGKQNDWKKAFYHEANNNFEIAKAQEVFERNYSHEKFNARRAQQAFDINQDHLYESFLTWAKLLLRREEVWSANVIKGKFLFHEINAECTAAALEFQEFKKVLPELQCLIGRLAFSSSDLLKKDFCFSMLHFAAVEGCVDSYTDLGLCYRLGKGTLQDFSKAIYYFRLAAANDNHLAQFFLGECLYHEEKTKKEGLEFLKLAADNGILDSQSLFGRLAYENGDFVEAFKYLKLAGDRGDGNSKFTLAECFAYGKGVEIDQIKAFKFFKQAANQGIRNAQFAISEIYKKCFFDNIENSQKSTHYLELAAQNGHIDAMANLGQHYFSGYGTTPDREKALKYFELAAEQGHNGVFYKLGFLHENGLGTIINYSKAADYYELAKKEGDIESCYSLGECYEFGWGRDRSSKKAHSNYSLAAARGHLKAQTKLLEFFNEDGFTAEDQEKRGRLI
jgi:TPR repeat protein